MQRFRLFLGTVCSSVLTYAIQGFSIVMSLHQFDFFLFLNILKMYLTAGLKGGDPLSCLGLEAVFLSLRISG